MPVAAPEPAPGWSIQLRNRRPSLAIARQMYSPMLSSNSESLTPTGLQQHLMNPWQQPRIAVPHQLQSSLTALHFGSKYQSAKRNGPFELVMSLHLYQRM